MLVIEKLMMLERDALQKDGFLQLQQPWHFYDVKFDLSTETFAWNRRFTIQSDRSSTSSTQSQRSVMYHFYLSFEVLRPGLQAFLSKTRANDERRQDCVQRWGFFSCECHG